MYAMEELAAQRARDFLAAAEQSRRARQLSALRRARRAELKAERRLIEAWRRAAEVRARLESADF
jgi:hypothetical protein